MLFKSATAFFAFFEHTKKTSFKMFKKEKCTTFPRNLLKKAKVGDIHSALLAYRATSLQSGFSPAELLMGRKLRTTVPITTEGLTPDWSYSRTFQQKDAALRRSNTRNFNQCHRTKELPPLQPNTYVWIGNDRDGIVESRSEQPRSYNVRTPSGCVRRNRRHLIPVPDPAVDAGQSDYYHTRSGRLVRPPDRLNL